MTGTWLFRVASNPKWGGGHVSRCRSIARSLRGRAPVLFVLDDDSAGWRERLAAESFSTRDENAVHDTSHDYWSGCVLDGYSFDDAYARSLRAKTGFLAALVDLQSPPEAADLVINAAGAGVQYSCRALTGLEFALVDSRFAELDAPRVDRRPNLLIAMGLRDAPNATALVLRGLLGPVRDELGDISVVLGGRADHVADIRALVAQIGGAVLTLDAEDMPLQVAHADVVISAGGVGLLECLAAGRPCIAITTADNQEMNVAAVSRPKAAVCLGRIADLSPEAIADQVRRLAQDHGLRETLGRAARETVDGHGAARVAAALLAQREDIGERAQA
jgi:spore coat polysaccharide biosynthesis predicted glycosyltransferase SpsG